MFKFFLLIIIPFAAITQENNNDTILFDTENEMSIEENTFHEYVSLNDNKVYDVEIIVFAYQQSLPNYKTYTNKALFDDSNALDLQPKPEDVKFIQNKEELIANLNDSENPTALENNQLDVLTPNETDPEYTVSIDDIEEDKQVLAWFQHDPEFNQLTPIWERLLKQDNIVPLIHKSWRQIETPFDNPSYVKLNNLLPAIEDESVDLDNMDSNAQNNTFENAISDNGAIIIGENTHFEIGPDGEFLPIPIDDIIENQTESYPDLTVSGMVALSQGRFMHFSHSLNLIRHYTDDNNEIHNMVFSLMERKQLKPDELHYFDSPWFGSIVKITEYLGEEELEENENGQINE